MKNSKLKNTKYVKGINEKAYTDYEYEISHLYDKVFQFRVDISEFESSRDYFNQRIHTTREIIEEIEERIFELRVKSNGEMIGMDYIQEKRKNSNGI